MFNRSVYRGNETRHQPGAGFSCRTRLAVGALGLCAALGLAPAAHANLLSNGGFEAPGIGSATFLNITPGAEPGAFVWSVTPAGVDIISDGVLGTSPGTIVEGVQALDLVGFGSTGGVFQDFATVTGQAYDLAFLYANNPVSTGGASARVVVRTGVTTVLDTVISHNTSTGSDFDWTAFAASFVATDTIARISFDTTVGGSNGGIFLDAVGIETATVAAPEPTSLGLLGVAIAALGAAARRRRSPRNGR